MTNETGTESLSLSMLDHGLQQLSGRLEQLEDASAESFEAITKSVITLQTTAAELVTKEREPVEPAAWAARATPKDWAELVDWIDWINTRYSITADYHVHPCWPAHPGVVEELAGIWRAWIRATVSDATAKGAGSAELAAWHDRWLWPGLSRIRQGHYRISNCGDKHLDERVQNYRTDRGLVPLNAAAALAEQKKPRQGDRNPMGQV
ncbi:MAG: hypothetical protein ACR2P2_09645 [Nakamurella sp.]